MTSPRFRHRKLLAFTAGIALLSATAWWQESWVRGWLQRQVVAEYIRKLEPRLPFKVEGFDIRATWAEFRKGTLHLTLVLKRDRLRIKLAGPLRISKSSDRGSFLVADYKPKAILEFDGHKKEDATPLDLDLSAGVPSDLSGLETFRFTARSPGPFRWDLLGIADIQGQSPQLNIDWSKDASLLNAELKAQGLIIKSGEQRAVSIETPSVHASFPLSLSPFSIGPEVTLRTEPKSAEVMWDESYLAGPLAALPLSISCQLERPQPPFRPRTLRILIGRHDQKAAVTLKAAFLYVTDQEAIPSRADVDWSTDALPVPVLAKLLLGLPAFKTLHGLELREGTLNSEGRVKIGLHSRSPLLIDQAQGSLRLDGLTARWRSRESAVRGLSLDFRLASLNAFTAKLNIAHAYWKAFHGSLAPTEIEGKLPQGPSGPLELSIPGGIPLQTDGIALKLGKVEGTLSAQEYKFTTSSRFGPVKLERLAAGMCAGTQLAGGKISLPEITAEGDFPKIEITPGSIEPEGALTTRLFDGSIRVDEIGLYDLGTGVPEINFSARWDGIRLDRLGDWLRFGRMDGIAQGHAQDVVFQSWLPTQFDFRFELKPRAPTPADPHPPRDIVFTPKAMKNFVRLVAGEAVDNLPGYADWFAFGWPRDFMGGYDVDCAGISAFSSSGAILIEGLPCQEALKKPDSHYILYDYWFRMPLNSPHFPLIVDATAMSNYTRQFMERFMNIAARPEKSRSEEINDDDGESKECLHPDFPR